MKRTAGTLLMVIAGGVACAVIWYGFAAFEVQIVQKGQFPLDGLGRQLYPTPTWARVVFSEDSLWAGAGSFTLDSAVIVAGAIMAFFVGAWGYGMRSGAFDEPVNKSEFRNPR